MSKKLWGGRFSKKTNPLVEDFTKSIDVDYLLARHDIMASLIHTKILAKAKLISEPEFKILYKGLSDIQNELGKGKFKFDKNSEDIHTDIQNKLERKVGPVALKLHTARSRNEQVVFDTKRYCVFEVCNIINKSIGDFIKQIEKFANTHKNIIMPGYTHMQHAQPVKFKDYILAYAYMLKRDSKRLEDSLHRLTYPLGSGALAGTSMEAKLYNEAAKEIAEKMDHPFFKVVENTIDNISDRDFIIEILSALAILGMHLSRMAEDFIIWSTQEFGFIEIDDAFCTGSSLMPQKKNPDTLELIRGHTGELYGNLVSVLVMMKGLPLTYNRDMQLDKKPLFSSIKIIKDELEILTRLIAGIKINKVNIKRQLEEESLYATDLAFYLAKNKVPFRKAHEIIGKLIKDSLDLNRRIKDMKDEELKKYSPFINGKVIKNIFNPITSVNSKKSFSKKNLSCRVTVVEPR
ncbi:MAG: argininosuccinate lyase [Candidatus Omnitrophica bacterium]|nr:argininosuccinate lyase [Candidatus Omnitrophota bacterium]